MNCNCNNNGKDKLDAPKIKLVYGNVLRLAIPLTLRTIEVVNNQVEVTDTDFIPSSEYPVKVEFSKGAMKFSLDAEMKDGNVAYVEDKGKIPVGTYEITVTCNDDNGYPYRFNQMSVLQVFHSTAEAGIVTPIEYEVTTWYLDAAIYLALKGEDGVGIEDIVTETSEEIGGTNTVTIILTDGRERSFTILNGSGAVDQELDITSPSPISNAAVTAKFSEIDAMLSDIIGDVDYDSQSKNIRFWDKDKTKVLMSLDARPFIKDGMVNSVYISNNILVITFNTDAGREAIGVPLTSIFNPNNYYNKTQVDNRLAQINALFSNYYNKSQIDTMLANIDVEGYAELDGLGELAYVNSAPVVLDEINSSYTSVHYDAQQYDFLDGTVRHCTDGKIRKYSYAIDGKDPFTGLPGSEDTIYVGVYRPSYNLIYYNKDDGKFYTFVYEYDSSSQTVVQYMSEILEQSQSDWNETDTTDPAYIKNKPTLITQSDIDATVAALVDSAPQTLDTLNELAAALGDDPNFATTITNALGGKVDKVNGKGLSTNDYTTAEKNKLAGIASGAEVNVQADWNVTNTSSDAFIKNKPSIPNKTSDLINDNGYTTNTGTLTEADFDVSTRQDGTIVMTVGEDTYTIDLNHEHPQYAEIGALADVATSGSYNDLTDKPVIPEGTDLSGYYDKSEVDGLLGDKVDKVSGKGLSANDYTTAEKNKLAGIAAGAEVNVNADWNATSGDARILNKPTLSTVATTGSYNDLDDKPTIPAAYDDTTLSGRVSALENAGYVTTETDPTVPAWAKQPNKPTYTAQEVGALPDSTKIPSKTSDLTNDSDFATSSDVDNAIAGLVDSAPGTLDTLNELAQALGDDPNFATTIATALGNKVDKESGKSLMTDAERTKLGSIQNGAEVNVNADWNATSGDAKILNKPTLAAVATSGSYDDLSGKPTIPAAYDDTTLSGRVTALENAGYITTETDPTVPAWAKSPTKPSYTASEVGAVPTTRKVNGKALSSDISLGASDVGALPDTTTIPSDLGDLTNNAGYTKNTGTITGIKMNGTSKGTSGVVDLGTVITAHQDISGKANSADLATVATSGSYNDLSNKPTIPAAQVQSDWDATSGMGVILNKPTIPSKTSDLTNDSGFVSYINHFKSKERCAVCTLTTNHRSWISQWADEL